MKLSSLITIVALASSAIYADTISGNGAFTNAATAIAGATVPSGGCSTQLTCTAAQVAAGYSSVYFVNPSGDNVIPGSGPNYAGYNFLTGTGAFAGGTNWVGDGAVYLGSGSSSIANNFNFVRQAGALSISVIYANSSGINGAEVGIYDATDATSAALNHQYLANLPGNTSITNADTGNIGNPSTGALNLLTNGASNYANWGIYVREVNLPTDFGNPTFYQNTAAQAGQLGTNPTVQTNDINHQHWALFQSATDASVYYLAMEDWAFGFNSTGALNSPLEGYGDYNDIIFQITTSAALGTPEPSTVSILGLGLVGLFAYARKFRK